MESSYVDEDLVYCYPNTNVLKNKLNIKDEKELFNFERDVTNIKEHEIRKNPIKGDFDFKHLKSIHRELFKDVYSWAGYERTVNISKGVMFCNVTHLQSYGNEIFERLRKDKFLIGLNKDKALLKLAEYFGDINALHPFRDGNGRTQRLFVSYLAKATGFKLYYCRCDVDKMMNASKKSLRCDYSEFVRILNDISEPMSLKEQRDFLESTSKEAFKVFEEIYKNKSFPDRVLETRKDLNREDENGIPLDDWKTLIENERIKGFQKKPESLHIKRDDGYTHRE